MGVIKRYIPGPLSLSAPQISTDTDRFLILRNLSQANNNGIIEQVSQLFEFTHNMFSELLEEATTTASRIQTLGTRVRALEDSLPFIESEAPVRVALSNPGVKFANKAPEDACKFMPDSRAPAMIAQHEKSMPPPNLAVLDEFIGEDEESCLKKYTNPMFFLESWVEEQNRLYLEAKKKRAKRRKVRKQAQATKKIEVKQVQLRRNKYNAMGQEFSSPAASRAQTSSARIETTSNRPVAERAATQPTAPVEEVYHPPPPSNPVPPPTSDFPPPPVAADPIPPPNDFPAPPPQVVSEPSPPPAAVEPEPEVPSSSSKSSKKDKKSSSKVKKEKKSKSSKEKKESKSKDKKSKSSKKKSSKTPAPPPPTDIAPPPPTENVAPPPVQHTPVVAEKAKPNPPGPPPPAPPPPPDLMPPPINKPKMGGAGLAGQLTTAGLKSVDPSDVEKKPVEKRSALLDSIQRGTQLKKVDIDAVKKEKQKEAGGAFNVAKIMERRAAMEFSDSEDDSFDDDNWDD